MTKEIDLDKYAEFVDAVTSNESKANNDYIMRWTTLVNQRNANLPRMLTACLGLSAEAGEFTEIVKKIVFQGKPLDDDNIFHMKRELGVIAENVKKLEARYPGGSFDAFQSENRKEGDL